MNNKSIIMTIATIILIVAAFFVGKSYGSSHAATATTASRTRGGMAGMTGTYTGRAGMAGGATIGQVVSMDSSSITVSIPNGGGSKIILYTPTTTVSKTTAGAISDVTVGSTITAIGTANSDGSITATAIQIRPAGSMMPQGGTGTAPTTSAATQ